MTAPMHSTRPTTASPLPPMNNRKRTALCLLGAALCVFMAFGAALALDVYKRQQVNRYKQLLNRVDTDYSSITFDDAVEFMNFSPAYFSRYFKKQAGMTFSQYLSTVRVEKACLLYTSGIVTKGVENTIRNVSQLGREGMRETDKEIVKIMLQES